MVLPRIARHTIGVVAVGARRYIDWFGALHRYCVHISRTVVAIIFHIPDFDAHLARYVALAGWSLSIWVAWNPLVDSRQDPSASPKSDQVIHFIGRLLFGISLCADVLLFEKFSIQWIAGKFHERSYAGQGRLILQSVHEHLTLFSSIERIADQKFAVKTLTTLYRHSTELSESHVNSHSEKHLMINPKRIVKQALRGVRFAATTTTTALGNVASEIAGRWAHPV